MRFQFKIGDKMFYERATDMPKPSIGELIFMPSGSHYRVRQVLHDYHNPDGDLVQVFITREDE